MAKGDPGTRDGWIKERFFKNDRVVADLTVNAESTNVITVDVVAKDLDGNVIDEVTEFEAVLFGANGIEALAAAFHLGESGAGTEISTTDNARLFFTTDANGSAQLEVTDVAGASGATVHLVLTPVGRAGFPVRAAVTFD